MYQMNSLPMMKCLSYFPQYICHSHKIAFKLHNIIFFLTPVTQVYKHDYSKHCSSPAIYTICRGSKSIFPYMVIFRSRIVLLLVSFKVIGCLVLRRLCFECLGASPTPVPRSLDPETIGHFLGFGF